MQIGTAQTMKPVAKDVAKADASNVVTSNGSGTWTSIQAPEHVGAPSAVSSTSPEQVRVLKVI